MLPGIAANTVPSDQLGISTAPAPRQCRCGMVCAPSGDNNGTDGARVAVVGTRVPISAAYPANACAVLWRCAASTRLVSEFVDGDIAPAFTTRTSTMTRIAHPSTAPCFEGQRAMPYGRQIWPTALVLEAALRSSRAKRSALRAWRPFQCKYTAIATTKAPLIPAATMLTVSLSCDSCWRLKISWVVL